MSRLFPTALGALCLALACVDAPVETPPDNGGPASTESDGETGDGDGDGEPGDGDGEPGDGDGGPGDGDGEPGDGDGDPSGDGDGDAFSFAAPITTEVFAFEDLQLGDLDADGCADLVLSGTGFPPRVNIYPSACDGSFSSPPITHELTSFDGFVLGDLDGDLRADLLARGSGAPPRIEARLSEDGFNLGDVVTSEVYTHDLLWAIDVTGDGRVEVLTHELEAGLPTVFAWTGPGDGTLVELASSEIGSFAAAAVGFLNADERGDLIAGHGDNFPIVNPWLGQADGTLSSGTLFESFTFTVLTLGDLDGDGRAELLTDVPNNDWRVTIYPNTAGGLAKTPTDLSAVTYTRLRSADVDGDGDDDVVLTPTGAPPRVMVWLSN